jgi:hypothetical protein
MGEAGDGHADNERSVYEIINNVASALMRLRRLSLLQSARQIGAEKGSTHEAMSGNENEERMKEKNERQFRHAFLVRIRAIADSLFLLRPCIHFAHSALAL